MLDVDICAYRLCIPFRSIPFLPFNYTWTQTFPGLSKSFPRKYSRYKKMRRFIFFAFLRFHSNTNSGIRVIPMCHHVIRRAAWKCHCWFSCTDDEREKIWENGCVYNTPCIIKLVINEKNHIPNARWNAAATVFYPV